MSDGSRNLTLPRSDKSVWDDPTLLQQFWSCDQERWLGAACGAALTTFGVRRGGLSGRLLITAGLTLAVRAVMGHRDMSVARDWVDQRLKENGWRAKDIVEETSEESFPASDAPSWTATV